VRYFVIALGSGGDVMPLTQLGCELLRRGHKVTMVIRSPAAVQQAGFGGELVVLCSEEEYEKSLRDVMLLNGHYKPLYFSRHASLWNVRIYKSIVDRLTSDTVLVTGDRPLVWADLILHAQMHVASIRVRVDLPVRSKMGGSQANHRAEGPLSSHRNDHWQAKWRALANEYGIQAGPNHVSRLFSNVRPWIATIGLWPDWLLNGRPRSGGMYGVGFLSPGDADVRDDGLRLDTDRPRIVFVAGTEGALTDWTRKFVQVSADVCRDLDCDGIVLGGAGLGIASINRDYFPDGFVWKPFSPLSPILAGASAIVHHGGVGTTVAAIKHGTPQLVVPRVFSQSANAELFRRWGVCESLGPREYSARKCSEILKRLIVDSEQRARSLELARQPGFFADISDLCQIVEKRARHLLLGKTVKEVEPNCDSL
jgi:UDP:flavonoid glycosyltransferase YjiC (YdhE family)